MELPTRGSPTRENIFRGWNLSIPSARTWLVTTSPQGAINDETRPAGRGRQGCRRWNGFNGMFVHGYREIIPSAIRAHGCGLFFGFPRPHNTVDDFIVRRGLPIDASGDYM